MGREERGNSATLVAELTAEFLDAHPKNAPDLDVRELVHKIFLGGGQCGQLSYVATQTNIPWGTLKKYWLAELAQKKTSRAI